VPELAKVLAAVLVLLPPLQAYELPPDAVNDTDPQSVAVPVIFAVGMVFTVTACDDVAVQPSAEVTVTVYVPEVAKVLAAELLLLPPLQAYVSPPEAVNETDPQAVAVPEIEAVGMVFTVTACDVVAVQPSAEVTVTV
jgi:hypothetical protein